MLAARMLAEGHDTRRCAGRPGTRGLDDVIYPGLPG